MVSLIKNKSFVLTVMFVIVSCLIMELLLKSGLTGSIVKPKSYLGTAHYRLLALKEFGLEKIDWITIGNSRFDWGLKHKQIYQHQLTESNQVHLRMSIESSDFYAIQTTIDWSIENMPNLKGIILGVSEFDVSHFSDKNNQYKVAWPFLAYENTNKYQYFNQSSWSDYIKYKSGTAVFLSDLKDLVSNIKQRFDEIDQFKNNDYINTLYFDKDLPSDLCEFDLSSVEQCNRTAATLKLKPPPLNGIERFIINACLNNKTSTEKHLKKINPVLLDNWQKLFHNTVDQGLELKVFLLPEHLIYDEILTSSNDSEGLLSLGVRLPPSQFELIDLRPLFSQKDSQCLYFRDPTHLNNKGQETVTSEVIKKL